MPGDLVGSTWYLPDLHRSPSTHSTHGSSWFPGHRVQCARAECSGDPSALRCPCPVERSVVFGQRPDLKSCSENHSVPIITVLVNNGGQVVRMTTSAPPPRIFSQLQPQSHHFKLCCAFHVEAHQRCPVLGNTKSL